MMKLLAITGMVLLMVAAAAQAQPSTQPGEGPRGPRREGRSFNPQDIPRAMEFAQENMPALHRMIQETDDPPRRRRLIGVAIERYQRAQRVEREHPELYEAMMERFRSQDEVFDLLHAYQQAPDDQKEQAREKLRAKVLEIVQGWMEERERRIENMQRMLQREIEQLERDRTDLDRLAGEHMQKLLELRDADMSVRELDRPPGGPGGPPGEPPGGGSGRDRSRGPR